MQRDITQANGIQELQALDNFMHYAAGNRRLAAGQMDALRYFQRSGDGPK